MTLGQLAWLADESLKSGKITRTAYEKIMNTEVVPQKLIDEVSNLSSNMEWEATEVIGFKYETIKDKFKQGRASAGREMTTFISDLLKKLYED